MALEAEMRQDGKMVAVGAGPKEEGTTAKPLSNNEPTAAAKPVGAGNKAKKNAAMQKVNGAGDKPAGAGKKMKTKRVMYHPEYVTSLMEKKAARDEMLKARFSYTFPMILKWEGISDEQRALAERAASILKKTQDEDDEVIRQYLEEGEAYYEVVTYERE